MEIMGNPKENRKSQRKNGYLGVPHENPPILGNLPGMGDPKTESIPRRWSPKRGDFSCGAPPGSSLDLLGSG